MSRALLLCELCAFARVLSIWTTSLCVLQENVANTIFVGRTNRCTLRSPFQREEHAMRIAAPNRVAHTYTQSLLGDPASVFPLLCPVREADWIDGWDPVLVASH